MTAEQMQTAGAFALYQAENPHRVDEMMKKGAGAQAAIAADFESYRSRYVRKFQDIQASLKSQGLVITRAG